MIRQPIVVIVGHIDHGKSSILEQVKGISITRGEAGGITQSIKSYNVPIENIKNCCGNLVDQLKQTITIPGLLFLDSPGHSAFNNMRKRGGNLADIAILTIDINEGVMDQTLECVEILKEYKTPFIVALNKLDLFPGWRPDPKKGVLQNIQSQAEDVKQKIDQRIYEILGVLAEKGLNSERFDRVTDYTQQVAMIPVSAKTQEGIPELLMLMLGLAQRFLENKLQIEETGEGKAIVLEVQEDKGMGTTLDVILYDGQLKQDDRIIIGTLDEPIVTKVRALFEPQGKKLERIDKIHAAYGVRISAPDVKEAIGGMPLIVANTNLEEKKEEVKTEIESVLTEKDTEGIIVKADTLGSLEALTVLLRKENIPIKKASIGDITKSDVMEASSEAKQVNRVILGFNVEALEGQECVKTILNPVIYQLIDQYKEWEESIKQKEQDATLGSLTRPVKLTILKGCVFRQSNPCVVGVGIEGGILKTNIKVMKADGSKLAFVKSLQLDGENVTEAEAGKEVAVSIPDVTVGRQIKEGDIMFSDITEEEFRKLKEFKKLLKKEEIAVLKEILEIKRKEKPLWGI